jgi:short-subunit dehydrogenase
VSGGLAIVTGASRGIGRALTGDFARDNDLKAELPLISLIVTVVVHLAKRVLRA